MVVARTRVWIEDVNERPPCPQRESSRTDTLSATLTHSRPRESRLTWSQFWHLCIQRETGCSARHLLIQSHRDHEHRNHPEKRDRDEGGRRGGEKERKRGRARDREREEERQRERERERRERGRAGEERDEKTERRGGKPTRKQREQRRSEGRAIEGTEGSGEWPGGEAEPTEAMHAAFYLSLQTAPAETQTDVENEARESFYEKVSRLTQGTP
ncbi:unnamed protein product [Pleuronectes platessa]|uniref:Uncharacterized protein n=1 Tax=Pleuronectes platessa TaxID=8262 RepID=A0A9N7TKC3_PLEPL|nr:unnamed protein product [Pleuronectes platessa]